MKIPVYDFTVVVELDPKRPNSDQDLIFVRFNGDTEKEFLFHPHLKTADEFLNEFRDKMTEVQMFAQKAREEEQKENQE
jgi:hypothetical protein